LGGAPQNSGMTYKRKPVFSDPAKQGDTKRSLD
jgi:hypothetical protein